MKLLEPIRIGEMWLKNRIVMAPMGTRLASEIGAVTGATKEYYKERARGGVGLIITETSWVSYPAGKYGLTHLRADEDRFIAGLNDLAEVVQAEGARIALQLYHAGRYGVGLDLVSASDVPHPFNGIVPRPLNSEEIKSLVEAFAESAGRARQAGFDAVEIHGAHGYLINQFLSPYTNRRTDEYGGTIEGRARFALEIVQAVRRKVGSKFPIIFRMSADEFVEGGLKLDESKVIAQMLEGAGVNALHVSAGIYESISWMMQPPARPKACLIHLAQGIKQKVSIPVISVGSITDPMLAEQILKEGKTDLVAMGRSLIADPEVPKKTAQGKFEDIRPCIRCNRCVERIFSHRRIRCTVNAFAGREAEFKLRPSQQPKSVLVVGGGPGGMEAARVLALRGHQVSLWEKRQRLGGLLPSAAQPPHKEELLEFTRWLEKQIEHLGVDIKLNSEVTPETVAELKPDAVIVATGSSPCVPQFPMSREANVVQAQDVLEETVNSGDTVIVAGGGTVGSETAEFLAEKGKQVTIVEMLDDIATDMEAITRSLLLARVREKGVRVLTSRRVREVTPKGLVVVDKEENEEELLADMLVLAIGSQPNRELLEKLSEKVAEVYAVGDCVMPRKIMNAVYEAAHIALEI